MIILNNNIILFYLSYRHDFFRLNSVTELGMAYYQQNKCLIQLREIMKIRKQCLWGKKVLEYGIPYKG